MTSSAAEQGAWFEDMCRRMLVANGFVIVGRGVDEPHAGVEIDFVAQNRHEIAFYITCKGSYEGERPGCERTDTLRKAIAEAYLLHEQGWGPVLLLTSHMPRTPSGRAALATVDPEVLFDALNPLTDGRRLRQLAEADEPVLRQDLAARRAVWLGRGRVVRPWGRFGQRMPSANG